MNKSFLSNLLKPRSSKPKNLPDYPTLDAIHMVGGKANVHKITTFGYGSPEPSERLPFVGEPADVHQSAHHGRPEGNVPLDENSQFELYEEEPGMFSVPDVVNLVVKNKDKKGRIKQIEEQDIARTSHIRYDGSEAEHVQQINQRSHSAANGELIENADISPGEGHHSEKSNKSQKIATDIDGTEKELNDGSDSISTKFPIMAENTLDSKVAKETDSSDEVMEKENAKAAEEGQYENNTEEVNNEETAGITSDADEKQKENEDKPLAETQTCTAEEVPLEPKTPNVTPAFSTEEILVDTSIVNSPSGKSPEEKGASNEKKGKSNVLKKKSKTIKKKSMKKPGAVTLISGKKLKKETFDIAKGTVIKSPADSVSPDKNKETQVILDEKNENESVEISETAKIKNTESTSSEVPISSNIQDADAGVHSKGDQVIETLRALRSEISKIDKESEEKEEEEEKEKTDKNCAKTDKEDKEHINKGSTESEEKEQTEKKENESANQEKSSKEDEKAMEDGKIKVEEDYTSKKEEAKADEEVPKPELKRTRSLVAITAEENFLYVRSQASSRAASPTNEGKDQPPDEDSSNNEQVPESHSQTKEKQSSDGSASKEEAEGRKEDVNQSETRVESNVNQSIPEDGVEGRMTDEKLSGGKVSVEDSGESGVPETQTENVKGNEKTETLKNEVKNADDKETISEKIDVIDNKKEDGVSSPSDKDATNAPSSENAYQKALETREDVLVEGLEESARSNTKDLADPTRLTRSANDIMMPYHTKPQRATMSAVEVPENAISTVSLSVANSGGMTGAGTRTVGLGDQMQGDRSYFDRFNAPGSLWQKASPYDVKPSKGVYFSEPREYEDYLPREPARPILQRRGSLSKIDMPKPYNDSYYMDDESYRWNSRYKESRGAQTVRIKNEQPRHGILKTTDAKYSDIPRKEDPHQALKDKLQEPIIIASGIVPDNLTYLTSEYQAIYGKVNPNVRPFPNPNTQIGNNNGKNQKNSTAGNNFNNAYDSYNSSNYVKSNNVYNQKNNGVSYGPNTIDSYNAYNANGDRWTGLIAAAQNNRDYLRREKEKFQEAYFDQGMPPAAITAPLVAPQSKNESVFERLHKNRKPEKPPTNSNTSTKKSDLPSKPAQTTNPPAKTGGKTISTTAALITNKDPMDKNPTLNAASNAAVAANAIASATGSNNAKGSDLEGNRKNQQNAGNDVFNRLYQNAPRKKEKDEEGDLLKAPDGNQPADAAIPGKKGAVKKPAANKGKGVANARKTKGDTKIDVPLRRRVKDGIRRRAPRVAGNDNPSLLPMSWHD
ncbi:hypothetical protein SK128_004883 [Halocaridina rubra]|uniref:Uncharacterized protein n=1 Tax=Halocaridina rubra TaxID=373956 RepID=A0AAN9A3B9_HALRR